MGRKFRPTGQPARTDQWRGEYKEKVKENALLERYYNAIIPEGEQEAFWASMRTVLPATFRLVGTSDDALAAGVLEGSVERIPSVPNAYKLPGSRRELRKDEQYVKLHQWLLKATEAGTVCRQEAVSMLPPLCLNIDRADLVMLDMCAAPGSKTGQMLEYLGEAGRASGEPVTGMVIANDADKNRAFMLHHQVRRLHSPALLVTCNDASMYPRMLCRGEKVLFDRVLCDVPCSGDGTLRKTPNIWATWSPHQAFGLHSLQRRILKRGLSLLKPGGRLVYSTCSLNPIEDEAVVASVLNDAHCGGSVKLVPVELPNLQVAPGRTSWSVMTADGDWHDHFVSGRRLQPTYFAPQNIHSLNMHYTFRVLPHHQDTGGFYVAVFEKPVSIKADTPISDTDNAVMADTDGAQPGGDQVGEVQDAEVDNPDGEVDNPDAEVDNPDAEVDNPDGEVDNPDGQSEYPDGEVDNPDGEVDNPNHNQEPTREQPRSAKKQRVERFKFDKFHVVPADSPLLAQVYNHYFDSAAQGDTQGATQGAFITRSADHDGPTPRSIVHCTHPVAAIISSPPHTLRIVNAGVRAYERYEPSTRHRDDSYPCQYRILSEYLYLVGSCGALRVHQVDESVFERLMATDTTVRCDEAPRVPTGGSVVGCGGRVLSVWKTGDGFVRPFISKQDRSLLA